MSGVNSKAELPPLLLTRTQLDVYLSATRGVRCHQVAWLEGAFEEEHDRFAYFPAMAQCSRVQRPPPPPHYIAQSRKSQGSSGGGGVGCVDGGGLGLPSDPARRVKQLERSIAFMRESHAVVLRNLHLEVDDLKTKNRDLVFQVVMTNPTQASVTEKEGPNAESILEEATKKIDKLEKEVRKLRGALREALKVNGSLNAQLETMKHSASGPMSDKSSYQQQQHQGLDMVRQQTAAEEGANQRPSSPKMEVYAETLQQIQQLSSSSSSRTRSCRTMVESGRSSKASSGASHHPSTEWTYTSGGGGGGGGGGGSHRERGRRHSDFQPHLPRLSLGASQLNLNTNSQTEVQFPNREGGDSLPSLKKPLFPALHQQQPLQQGQGQQQQQQGHGSQGDRREGHTKPRKPRGAQKGRSSASQGQHHHNHQGNHNQQ